MFAYSEGSDHPKIKGNHRMHSVIYFSILRAGIGDGGNDVGMIQLASIGLGIVGKEGNHAALASDISMN